MSIVWPYLIFDIIIATAYVVKRHNILIAAKLGDLRNAWLMIFAVSNTLWLILIYTLADKGKILSVFGSNPIGMA